MPMRQLMEYHIRPRLERQERLVLVARRRGRRTKPSRDNRKSDKIHYQSKIH